MLAMFKVAAAAVLALSAGVAYLISPRVEATTAFAEAAEKLRDARTLSYVCKTTMQVAGQERPTEMRQLFLYKDPGLTRVESGDPPIAVNVIDASRGRILILDLVGKTAMIQDWKVSKEVKANLERHAVGETEHLRSLAGKNGEPVGRRKVGDVEAEGFRVEDVGFTWTVWVDAARKFPLLVESSVHIDGRDVPVALSDFRIDPPLDDALFRLDPPDGFRVRKLEAPLATGEEALVNLLRIYAEASDGSFPPKLDDMKALGEVPQGEVDRARRPEDDPVRPVDGRFRGVRAVRPQGRIRLRPRQGQARRGGQDPVLVPAEGRQGLPGDFRRPPRRGRGGGKVARETEVLTIVALVPDCGRPR